MECHPIKSSAAGRRPYGCTSNFPTPGCLMALSTLYHGRRIWCSLLNKSHAMPESSPLLRKFERDVITIRGLWQSSHVSQSHCLRSKIAPVRCLATVKNDPNQKEPETTENNKTGKLYVQLCNVWLEAEEVNTYLHCTWSQWRHSCFPKLHNKINLSTNLATTSKTTKTLFVFFSWEQNRQTKEKLWIC